MTAAIEPIFDRAPPLLLALDVAFDGLLGDSTSGRDEVGASPERRQPEQVRVLLPQQATASTFERLHDLRRRMMGIRLNEKVDEIRQDSDLDDLPVLFSSDFGDDLAKASGKSTLEYLGSPGWAPHEMKLDRMDSVPTVTICLVCL